MSEEFPYLVIASLWGHLEPIDRGERYEDPLANVLEQKGVGGVAGGGSQLSETGEIESADVEIELANLDSALTLVRETLEALGAPVGSELQFERNGESVTVPFGKAQVLAIYLDGAGLPAEVYTNSDINVLIEQLGNALNAQGIGEIRNYWQGPRETALYVYGEDSESIFRAIQSVVDSYPLCQNARLVFRSRARAASPKEVRIPFRP